MVVTLFGGAQTLGHADQVVAHGFSCPVACGILGIKLTRDQTHVSSLAGGSLTIGPPGKTHDSFLPSDFQMYSSVCYFAFYRGFLCGSDGKASDYNVGDLGSVPGSGRSSGEGNGNPLQYYWKIPWTVTVHGVAKIQT